MSKQHFTLAMAALLLIGGGVNSAYALPTATQQASTATCSGQVTDSNGEPLIGAAINVVGSKASATTDFDGKFSLPNIPVGSTIKISYIGYDTATQVWDGQPMKVSLKESSTSLSEVVVLGYTVQSKESVNGSLTTIKDTKLHDVTTQSLATQLNGKVSGVQVTPGSGQPGSSGSIVIRGQASLGGSTAPLWVIDGVIVGTGAGDLNPNDVESMTILKDAASTAIYGSDGANGVVVVTTKKAKAGQMSVNISAKWGISNLDKGNIHMMNGAELYDYYASMQNPEDIKHALWTPELRNKNFDWWDLATHTGFAQDYSIALSGGTDKMRTYTSIGYYDEDGAVKGYDYKKYTIRTTNDYRPAKWISIRPTIAASMQKTKDKQYSVGAMYSMMPWDSPYDEEGNLVGHRSPTWWNSSATNYLLDLDYGNSSYGNNYEANVSFDFDIYFTDWLTFGSVNSYRYNYYKSGYYSDPRSSGAMGVKGRLYEWNSDVTRRSTTQKLMVNKTIDQKHRIQGFLAYEFKDYTYNYNSATGTGFVPGFEILDVTAVPEAVGGGKSEWAVESYFTQWNYMYDSRYMIEASLRRDGASNLGKNKRWGTLWSVAGGWIVNRESFWKPTWWNYLKLRASYGSMGNRPTSLYPGYDLYRVSVNYDGEAGALISQIGNPDLTWERTKTFDVGFDAYFFNERLRANFDYYIKNTDNILYSVPVTGLVGVTSIYRNVGKMRNTGVEITLAGDIIATNDWTWTVEANLSHNKNELRDLFPQKDADGNYSVRPVIISDGSGIAGSAQKILEIGYPIDTYYIREWAGVDTETGLPLWYKDNEDGTRTTTSKVAEADFYHCGKTSPDVWGGFSTTLRWRNLDFSANFGYAIGGQIFNYSRIEYDSDGAYADRNQMALQDGWTRWQKPGDVATHPRAVYNNSDKGNSASSRYLEKSDFLKLRSLTLGYTFDNLKKYGIQRARVSLSGENLFTITDYSGVDPELQGYGMSGGSTGPSVYPSVRRFSLGLNVSF